MQSLASSETVWTSNDEPDVIAAQHTGPGNDCGNRAVVHEFQYIPLVISVSWTDLKIMTPLIRSPEERGCRNIAGICDIVALADTFRHPHQGGFPSNNRDVSISLSTTRGVTMMTLETQR